MGRCKTKPRQRLEGYCMSYADYFADDPMHSTPFQDESKVVIYIMIESGSMTPTSSARKVGFSSIRKFL
jgi:hypothetical protein